MNTPSTTTLGSTIRRCAAAGVVSLLIAACGGSSDGAETFGEAQSRAAESNPAATDTAEPDVIDSIDSTDAGGADVASTDADAGAGADAGADAGSGILVEDGPTRFHEVDWTIVDVERRPDGPTDEGEDTDPSEDFLYVDVDATSPVPAVTFQIPYEWLTLVDADGAEFRPGRAVERGSGDRLSVYIDLAPNRDVELTVVFAIDAEDSFDGGHIELNQQGYLPAATAGTAAIDESQRLDATFDTTIYDGPFSRDEGTVDIVEAYWSRELGTDADGNLLESPSNFSRRPSAGEAWLLVHFEVTCRLTTINTGGCNVAGGEVEVDGDRAKGSTVNGLVGYDATKDFWAAYPVSFEAGSVSIDINGQAPFQITDLTPLQSLVTPES